jgi:hypothetical protein
MIVLWILFLTGLIGIPAAGLFILRWAARNGEFRHLDKIALSIFNEEEPVGELTDRFPHSDAKKAMSPADSQRRGALKAPPPNESRSCCKIRTPSCQPSADNNLN